MTTYFPVTVSCARCGTESEHHELGSVFSSGYPDLDGRPPGQTRGTMSSWLQECPNCLYVARDLSVASAEEADVVREIGFIEAGLSENMPDLAVCFMRRAYIDEQTGRTRQAARRLLHAAWVLDDHRLDATSVRTRSAELVLALGDHADAELRLARLDLLRRTKAFKETIAEAALLLRQPLEPIHRKVAAAQHRAAIQNRSGAISLGEALHPPRAGRRSEPIPPEWRDLFP